MRPIQIRSLLILLPALVLALTAGCRRTEESSGVAGSVAVDNGSAADVTVELYAEPVPETGDVWDRTATTSAVGFPYSLQACFEHRLERRETSSHPSLLRGSTTTDGEGKFEFADIPSANYVVVARKSGYGWSEPRAVSVGGGKAEAGTLQLRPEHIISRDTTIFGEVRWLEGHHYVLLRNLTVAAGARLIIEPGAVVRVDEAGGEIRVRGTLEAVGRPDAYITFTSNNIANPGVSDWIHIRFYAEAEPPLFRYCSFSFSDMGIRSLPPGGTVEYCFFRAMGNKAIDLTGQRDNPDADSVVVRGNVFDRVPLAVTVFEIWNAAMSIEHNAVFGSSLYGMDIEVVRGGQIFCNWFNNCGRADTLAGQETGVIFLRDARDCFIHYNEFELSWYALTLGSRVDSSTHIEYNKFFRMNRIVHVGITPDQSGASWPHFNYNCVERSDRYVIWLTGGSVNNRPIDARNTYWGSTSETEILQRMIRDCDDDELLPCVEFRPILLSCQADAGICR